MKTYYRNGRLVRSPAKVTQANADTGQGDRGYDDLLNKILAGDLRLDADELEQVADLLGDRKLYLAHEIARQPTSVLMCDLDDKLRHLEHILERINEACAML